MLLMTFYLPFDDYVEHGLTACTIREPLLHISSSSHDWEAALLSGMLTRKLPRGRGRAGPCAL
jgi:hypothetical protein